MTLQNLVLHIDPLSNLHLLVSLLQHCAVYATIILLLGKHPLLRSEFASNILNRFDIRLFLFFFAVLGIGEMLAIPYHGTYLYSNGALVLAGGYLYGIGMGLALGTTAGIFHLLTADWLAIPLCFLSIAMGLAAGWVGSHGNFHPLKASMHIFVISFGKFLLFPTILSASPVALFLFTKSGPATLLVEFSGALLLMYVLHFLEAQRHKEHSFAASNALQIASRTITVLKGGISPEAAQGVCEIIRRHIPVDSVAITDRKEILAIADDSPTLHESRKGQFLFTRHAHQAMQLGEIVTIRDELQRKGKQEKYVYHALYVPLFASEQVTGLLILHNWGERHFSPYIRELINGLQQLIGIQIELAKLQKHKELSVQAELLALQRQINPHFFFNSLNTIMSLIRIDPPKARRLLLKMSEIFRVTFKSTSGTVPLSSEIEIVKSYLELEKARFGDKIHIVFTISPQALRFHLPQLIIQPLVENSIAHGFKNVPGDWHIAIDATIDSGIFLLNISDNGNGIPQEQCQQILEMGVGNMSGVGLSNVYERLRNYYGKRLTFTVDSSPGNGFKVKIAIQEE
ncbi:histidine kinase [Chrysiogenes arsenatis]|uniref:histidine kinase n=1 Tax=Chrysiogenes arsenatis TaxID=309797 RepID=UPI00041B9554|nr:histidine kinase [Chrysiogenes arsenatis]